MENLNNKIQKKSIKKIAHICSDEKFINSAYWQFEAVDNINNDFFILVDDIKTQLKYVNQSLNFTLHAKTTSQLKALGKSLSSFDLICIHGLDYYRSIVVNNIPNDKKILWILFGSEFYNNPIIFKKKKILGEITLKHYYSNNLKHLVLEKINYKIPNVYHQLKYGKLSPSLEILHAMKKADYCGILYKEEFDLIKNTLNTNIKHVKFSYYPIEKMVRDINVNVSGQNILLGNSASYTNNHFEIFNLLAQIDLEKRKVITPLSYGDDEYKTQIIKKGKEVLEKNFEPLIEFMPLYAYNEYIKSCSIVIMNHYRQQAVGNVLTMLWMGAKVFLSEKNTLYKYLKRIDIIVFEVSKDLNKNNKDILKPLTHEQQQYNRNILKSIISEKVLLSQLDSTINKIA